MNVKVPLRRRNCSNLQIIYKVWERNIKWTKYQISPSPCDKYTIIPPWSLSRAMYPPLWDRQQTSKSFYYSIHNVVVLIWISCSPYFVEKKNTYVTIKGITNQLTDTKLTTRSTRGTGSELVVVSKFCLHICLGLHYAVSSPPNMFFIIVVCN